MSWTGWCATVAIFCAIGALGLAYIGSIGGFAVLMFVAVVFGAFAYLGEVEFDEYIEPRRYFDR